MAIDYDPNFEILLSSQLSRSIIKHCRVHLKVSEPNKEKKAFGLVAGTIDQKKITVSQCHPLKKNVRNQEPFKNLMDSIMDEFAFPSETPLALRGWVADTEELQEAISAINSEKLTVIGTYHMHRVAWDHDQLRDTPTKLDSVLAEHSRLIMFIVSMVNPDGPIIRAFYEGRKNQEIPIIHVK